MFVQVSLSYRTSLQAEFRYNDFESGDLPQFFHSDIFFPTLRKKAQSKSVRLGFHHGFSPRSDIIASVIYRSADFEDKFPGIFDRATDEDAYMAEAQHLFRAERLNLISGVGHFGGDQNEIVNDGPSSQIDLRHTNAYVYAHFNFIKHLTLTLAGSADFFKDATAERNQFNPKMGVTWNPLPGTTLRAAAFRTLKRRVVASQTIEPTQIAGFNQFFDDANGTNAWRYGAALDQKFSARLYAGAEWSARDLDVPTTLTQPVRQVVEIDRDERLARAYVNWTPWPWLALRAEYQYEELILDPEARNPLAAAEVRTHRVPLGLGIFHPTGFRTQWQATYIDQAGKFEDVTRAIVPGDDQFWVVDVSFGYRLPKRWGLVEIGIKNLFDHQFQFQDTDPETPVVSPERLVLARFTLAF